MKSFDDLDKNIDKYYEGSLDSTTPDELELKTLLDRMSLADNIEDNISIPISISSIVETGQEIRLKNRLRQATFKFLSLAILLSVGIGFMAIKISIPIIMVAQFVILIVLLTINIMLIKRKARREVQ